MFLCTRHQGRVYHGSANTWPTRLRCSSRDRIPGIANALKKIGGYSEASLIARPIRKKSATCCSAAGAKLFGMFATHPPLIDRIRALDPNFDESPTTRTSITAMPQRM